MAAVVYRSWRTSWRSVSNFRNYSILFVARLGVSSSSKGFVRRGERTPELVNIPVKKQLLTPDIAVGAQSGSSNPISLDVLLCFLRGALGKFSRFLNCPDCLPVGANNALLAMAARYMSTLSYRLVKSYARMVGDYVAHLSPPAIGGDPIWFSSYSIEDTYERLQVMRCLVSVQLAQFWRLLQKFRARPEICNGHRELLVVAEKRIQEGGAMLRRMQDDPMMKIPVMV